MSRIAHTLASLKANGRKALIPYVTAGDPFADATPEIMQALADGGADIIELGVPFSDPMADGPVVQKASERALARGIGMPQVLDMVRSFRRGFLPAIVRSRHWIADPAFAQAIAPWCEEEARSILRYKAMLDTHTPFRDA